MYTLINNNMINLNNYYSTVYSQSGEDGIIQKIFSTLNIERGWYCEFGATDGMVYCNTRNLREKDWKGVLIEGNANHFSSLKQNLKNFNDTFLLNEFISFENGSRIDDLLKKTPIPNDFDFLSIDIDGNDLWIWDSIKNYKPKVVMVEYNSNFSSTESLCIKYDALHRHELDAYYSATVGAYKKIADSKGYKLVGYTLGLNLIFCREDLSSPFYEYQPSEIPILRVWPIKEKSLFPY